jgi:hypothetical protein
VLFDIQDKALRSLLSGVFFTRIKELFPYSQSAVFCQNSDMGEVIVVWFQCVQRFPCPGQPGESGNHSGPVPSKEQRRGSNIRSPEGSRQGADQRPDD